MRSIWAVREEKDEREGTWAKSRMTAVERLELSSI